MNNWVEISLPPGTQSNENQVLSFIPAELFT